MHNIKARLAKCFSLAVPQMSPEEFQKADDETVRRWDSIALLTLLVLISEEFGVSIGLEEFEKGISFQSLALRIEERLKPT
jgi:acyl carrier protein